MTPVRLITLDPGHFHAALVQKEMYPQVDRRVHVYAPLSADLTAHLNRIAAFNSRGHNPTAWKLEVHAGPDFLARLVKEMPGNVVVLAGRNRAKIDYILAALRAGFHVLADKPWILTAPDLDKLSQALDVADASGLIALDIMTERHEITSNLQRELINDETIFGTALPGTPEEPGVYMESVHFLKKNVAGVPLRRPAWFFDITQQGEGLTDVGPHLVDLAMWLLFPEQTIDFEKDIRMISGRRWPTAMAKSDFQVVTGETDFPAFLTPQVQGEILQYYCNNSVNYVLRGIHVKLDALWGLEAEAGAGDTHLAVVRGSRAVVEIRQGREQNFRPELYVLPHVAASGEVGAALARKIGLLQARYPGLAAEKTGERWRVRIPDQYRVGHEAHFAEVTKQFLGYLENPRTLPAWEKPNMLAKYFVTTQGVELSRATESVPARN